MIDIENLTYRIGNRILFEDATLHFPMGEKIGLIGPNGSGKSTLFRIILGQEEIDGGEICVKTGAKLVCVKQELDDPEKSILDFVMASDSELVRLKKTLDGDHSSPLEELAIAYDRYAIIGGDSAEARAAGILAGLGFKQNDLSRKLESFSGGWQMRASLAATLFAPSDCLLLDEPTNHLDLETAVWLENFLDRTEKMIVMISHEKQFLNKICNYIVSVHGQQLHLFKGNYDTYVETKSRGDIALTKNIENMLRKREHMQDFVDRFGAKATKAKQAQSRLKMIEKMKIPARPTSAYRVTLSFSQPSPKVDRKLIELENVSMGYGAKVILRGVNFCVNFGERIAFLGANGNGKSTLAKILSFRMEQLSGTVSHGRNVKISYFSQQQADELDLTKTPIETLRSVAGTLTETQIRAHLAKFGLTQARGETTIANLSGGEKSRVLLALNSLFNPHAMIFDEPTNHLDIEAREAFVGAVREYEGAVILITHDFYTLSQTCNKFFLVDGGRCERFTGTLEDYRNLLLGQDDGRTASEQKNRQKAEAGKGTAQNFSPEKKRKISSMEKNMAMLEHQKMELERELSNGYDRNTYDSYLTCCKELKKCEGEWFELSM